MLFGNGDDSHGAMLPLACLLVGMHVSVSVKTGGPSPMRRRHICVLESSFHLFVDCS